MSRTFVEGLLFHCLTLPRPDTMRRATRVVTHAAAWAKNMNERQRRGMGMLHFSGKDPENAKLFKNLPKPASRLSSHLKSRKSRFPEI